MHIYCLLAHFLTVCVTNMSNNIKLKKHLSFLFKTICWTIVFDAFNSITGWLNNQPGQAENGNLLCINFDSGQCPADSKRFCPVSDATYTGNTIRSLFAETDGQMNDAGLMSGVRDLHLKDSAAPKFVKRPRSPVSL